jgi:hypothetical protein
MRKSIKTNYEQFIKIFKFKLDHELAAKYISVDGDLNKI